MMAYLSISTCVMAHSDIVLRTHPYVEILLLVWRDEEILLLERHYIYIDLMELMKSILVS